MGLLASIWKHIKLKLTSRPAKRRAKNKSQIQVGLAVAGNVNIIELRNQ